MGRKVPVKSATWQAASGHKQPLDYRLKIGDNSMVLSGDICLAQFPSTE
jgi:hypothetical protein